ncbi:SnoaL-like domain-containing protein [Sphingobium faniae]|nr:SnoaL-like domain-containing protein [Sphingobium faniae]
MYSLNQLNDLAAVKDLKAKYCYYADTRNWEGFASIFTQDATFDIRAGMSVNPDLSQDRFTAGGYQEGVDNIIAHVRRDTAYLIKSIHQCHNPDLTFESDDEIYGIWPLEDRLFFEENSPMSPIGYLHAFGHYHEKYTRMHGEWRIRSVRLTRLHVDLS